MKVAIIFAAGAGKRLNPLTQTIHKSLIKINEKPLIEYLINNLQTLKTLKEIIIVTGYRHEDFLYLKDKYQNLKLIFNQYYNEYESGYVFSLLPKEIFNHDIFIISGDFIMKKNCFNDQINENVMAALKRNNTKKDWSYKLNQSGNIIGLEKNTALNSLLASEWSHVTKEWNKKIANFLDSEQEIIILKKTMIGQYLIKCSIRDKINLKPHLLEYNNFWDLDSIKDLERIIKYFHC
ncbi:MAG: sugar phosphate nucleotidyltransferase [Spiroplasma sp.]